MKAFGKCNHRRIFRKHVGFDSPDFLCARNLKEATHQLAAEPGSLIAIRNDHTKLGLLDLPLPCQASNTNQPTVASLFVKPLRDERNLTVVIKETLPDQPLVRDTRFQSLHLEKTSIHSAVRQGLVKFHHQRFVFRPYRTKNHVASVLHRPMRDIFGWVTTDRGPRKVCIRNLGAEENHPRIERHQLLGRCDQRIDIDFAETWLVYYKLAEPHHGGFQCVEVDGFSSPDSLERLKDFGSFHKTFRQSGVQRWKRQGLVAVHLHELST